MGTKIEEWTLREYKVDLGRSHTENGEMCWKKPKHDGANSNRGTAKDVKEEGPTFCNIKQCLHLLLKLTTLSK